MKPIDLKNKLETALDENIDFKEAIYVNWPYYPNSGDHFIAAASFVYCKQRGIDIREIYANSQTKFFGHPLIVQGGGNLGDLYYHHESFRCELIRKNHISPIVIFPQSIYFRDPEKAKFSSNTYNAHPDLTLFVREQKSYEIAQELFGDCKVVLCPDVAWCLTEIVQGMRAGQFEETDKLIKGYEKVDGGKPWNFWAFHDWLNYFKGKAMFSVAVTYYSMFQLAQCKFLRTERLHGHIMACMMGIKNELLPAVYHKSESTYETWTKHLPNTSFARV